VARSTEKAELLALDECVDYLAYVAPLLEEVFGKAGFELHVHSDAQNVIDLISNPHPRPSERSLIKRIRALQGKAFVVPCLSLRDKVEEEGIAIHKIHTSANLSDALTKPMSVANLQRAMVVLRDGEPVPEDRGEDDAVGAVAPHGAPAAAETAEFEDGASEFEGGQGGGAGGDGAAGMEGLRLPAAAVGEGGDDDEEVAAERGEVNIPRSNGDGPARNLRPKHRHDYRRADRRGFSTYR
jgi:hypothetical protein